MKWVAVICTYLLLGGLGVLPSLRIVRHVLSLFRLLEIWLSRQIKDFSRI